MSFLAEESQFRIDPDEERRRKAKYLEELKNSPVHKKTTASYRASTTNVHFKDVDAPDVGGPEVPFEPRKERKRKEGTISDFIDKKREMFLLEYALSVKREEMRKLEQLTSEREDSITKAEKQLEEDSARFEALLKENNLKTMEATKRAEAETKAKLEKAQEIKRLSMQLSSIQNEISKYSEKLEDYRWYKKFLDSLSPQEWLESEKGETEMFFREPQQLLDVFKALEEKNMFLIHHSQETERVLEDLQQKQKELQLKMDRDTSKLKAQIRSLEDAIALEKQKKLLLRERAGQRIGVESTGDQEKELEALHKKVEEVYIAVVGENVAGMKTMLTAIERQMEKLFELKKQLAPEYVQQAEKIKEKARRQKLREEKLERQKAEQERKIQRAIDRSQKQVVKRTGKPVMFRSVLPPKVNRKEVEAAKRRKEEEEDLRYFGLLAS